MFEDDIQRMKFDNRLFEFQLRHGLITKEEIQKHLNSLKDEASNASKIKLFDENEVNGHAPDNLN